MIMHVTGFSRSELVLAPREVTPEELERIDDIVKRRESGEPLQYILGETEFMGLRFRVTPDTLIPRADTETLAEAAAEYIGNNRARVLDIGTGSGCIGISIAKLCCGAEVTLLDISAAALKIAEKNAEDNGVYVKLLRCDILNEMPEGKYDVIVSNPPYIRTDVIDSLDATVREYEPLSALDGGGDGLMFYRRITELAPLMLANGGLLAYEIGYDQGAVVTGLLAESGFCEVKLIKDPCGNDRVVIGRLQV